MTRPSNGLSHTSSTAAAICDAALPAPMMVANKDGQPAFVPVETNTKEDIQRSSYTDVDGNPVMAGWYVGDYPLPFDWVEAVERLGN